MSCIARSASSVEAALAAITAHYIADIRSQVAAGAQHITFGDPDFFNGPVHAMRIVRALHEEFPELTYDVTIKVEHLRRHADLLPVLRDMGCALVTTAVESFEGVIFFARLIATLFPVLDHFNVQAAVAGGTTIPLAYLGYALIYCLIYGTIAMLLGTYQR